MEFYLLENRKKETESIRLMKCKKMPIKIVPLETHRLKFHKESVRKKFINLKCIACVLFEFVQLEIFILEH